MNFNPLKFKVLHVCATCRPRNVNLSRERESDREREREGWGVSKSTLVLRIPVHVHVYIEVLCCANSGVAMLFQPIGRQEVLN